MEVPIEMKHGDEDAYDEDVGEGPFAECGEGAEEGGSECVCLVVGGAGGAAVAAFGEAIVV